MSTNDALTFKLHGDWLVFQVDRCTCDGPFPGAPGVDHRDGCGLEPVMTMQELDNLLRSGQEQWSVYYGGPDPDNAAGCDLRDDEADALDHVQWLDGAHGKGVAVRAVYYGPWTVVGSMPLAAESRGDGDQTNG